MTFEKFKKEIIDFIEDSNVNLGRKTSQTRLKFIKDIGVKFDSIIAALKNPDHSKKQNKKANPMDDRIKCMKPKNRRKVLDVGKGVTAMTPTESVRADEQLGRSPYANKKKEEG